MSLAAIHYERGFRIDEFMATVAQRLRAEGVRLCGLVQENVGEGSRPRMILVDLGSDSRFRISQTLGAGAEGCRMDPHGFADAGACLDQAIVEGADLVVLDKFGRAEAEEGAGLRDAVARALEYDIPVLTAVRPPYDEAWSEFHGGFSTALAPDLDAVLAWCTTAISARRAAERNRGGLQ